MCFIWNQVLPTDESVEHKKSHRQSHRKKVLPEIYLTRLLSTKVGAGLPLFLAGGIVCGLQGEACSREGALQGWLLPKGRGTPLLGGWSIIREAVGLLGVPPASQCILAAV